jgi:hypothetical protein
VNADTNLGPDDVAGRFWLASAQSALGLGGLTSVLLGVCVVLTIVTHDLRVSNDGFMFANVLSFGAVGLIVARRQPQNAIGWILVGVSLSVLLDQDAKLYSVLDYRLHDGKLPLGHVAVYLVASGQLLPIVIGMLAVLLFPDGRLPSRRWRFVLWTYLAVGAVFTVGQFAGEATVPIGRNVVVDSRGNSALSNQTGWWGAVWLLAPLLVVLWAFFVGRQVGAWRRSTGAPREQLKWLMSGSAICLVATIGLVLTSSGSGIEEVVAAGATLAIAALPLSVGVGILRYRLYEIDRLISRTLSYLIITGLLAGVFVGIVVLTTRVLPFSSPVGVAASTLAAAAMFNPLRLRVQRFVDRRFNRARYDSDAIVAAFTLRLRDAVDLNTVGSELLGAVDRAVQPSHASLWIRPPAPRSRP